jgi:hypothetical protein
MNSKNMLKMKRSRDEDTNLKKNISDRIEVLIYHNIEILALIW